VFTGTPSLSQNGLIWVGAVNGAEENIFFYKGAYAIIDLYNMPDGLYENESIINLTITPVPEPATWVLMVLGFAWLGFMASAEVKAGVDGRLIHEHQGLICEPP
jgi:hypothetical protein